MEMDKQIFWQKMNCNQYNFCWVWWDRRRIIHFELLPRGDTTTVEKYCEQLTKLNMKIKAKQKSTFKLARLIVKIIKIIILKT